MKVFKTLMAVTVFLAGLLAVGAASAAITATFSRTWKCGKMKCHQGSIAFDSSYPTGGESYTSAFSNVIHLDVSGEDGYVFETDYTNGKIIARDPAYKTNSVLVTDDDSAASNGVAIYLHLDENIVQESILMGHIESVTAGNADTYIAMTNGGPTLQIFDDDAASTNGKQLYFDEDGTNADERVLADLDLADDSDVFVQLSDGSFLRLQDDDSASSNGVALYVDDDASNDYERLLFVGPSNADGTGSTDDDVGTGQMEMAQVPNATDLSGVTAAPFFAVTFK